MTRRVTLWEQRQVLSQRVGKRLPTCLVEPTPSTGRQTTLAMLMLPHCDGRPRPHQDVLERNLSFLRKAKVDTSSMSCPKLDHALCVGSQYV